MSGTDIHIPPHVLRIHCTMSGTDIGYAARAGQCVLRGSGATYGLAMRCPVLTYRMARAMRCPVLTYRMVLPVCDGTGAVGGRGAVVSSAICLRVPYAMPGTHIEPTGSRALRDVRYSHSVSCYQLDSVQGLASPRYGVVFARQRRFLTLTWGISSFLRACYAMSGIVVPPHTAFGPLSSSYEIGDGSTTGGEAPLFDGNARYCRQRFPEPVWYLKLLGFLVMLIVWLVEQIPVLILLRLIVIFPVSRRSLPGRRSALAFFSVIVVVVQDDKDAGR
eukprot:836152-Rhodomonas_salina.2